MAGSGCWEQKSRAGWGSLLKKDAAGFFEGLAEVQNWAEIYPGRLDTGCPGQKKGKDKNILFGSPNQRRYGSDVRG
jgi:hypothetical protein